MQTNVIWGILIPFAGTALGSACVLFLKKKMNLLVQRSLTGFAAGVMVAASVWSLLIPAMEQAEAMGQWAFVPAAAGFWIGILFLLLLDKTIPHLHMNSSKAEGPKSSFGRSTMLVLAVTLHNLPEGMAVGVVAAGAMVKDSGITMLGHGCAGTFTRHCHTEFPGGRDYFHAFAGRRSRKREGFSLRSAFRGGGTHWSGIDFARSALCGSLSALSFELCGRSHGVCGGGGADSGNV